MPRKPKEHTVIINGETTTGSLTHIACVYRVCPKKMYGLTTKHGNAQDALDEALGINNVSHITRIRNSFLLNKPLEAQ